MWLQFMECHSPQRDIPRKSKLTCLAIVMLYLASCAATGLGHSGKDIARVLSRAAASEDPCNDLWVYYHEDWGQSGMLSVEVWGHWLTVVKQVLPGLSLLEHVPPTGQTVAVSVPLKPDQCRVVAQALLGSRVWSVGSVSAAACGPGEPAVELTASVGDTTVMSFTGCRWRLRRCTQCATFLSLLEKFRRSIGITMTTPHS